MYIDTLKTMDQLVESGMNDKQAKTLVSIFSELIQNQFGLLATKEDLAKTSNECKGFTGVNIIGVSDWNNFQTLVMWLERCRRWLFQGDKSFRQGD